MSASDNSEELLPLEKSTIEEVASTLQDETDKTHEVFKEALNEGDVEAADAAYKTFSDVDNKRLQFDRAVKAVKEVLDNSE